MCPDLTASLRFPARIPGRPAARRAGLLGLIFAALFLNQCAAPRTPATLPSMDSSLTQWTAGDGRIFPCKYWPGAPAKPRAVVICIHGLSGAASDFWPVGESFPAHGYAVYGMQVRGQGYDPDLKRRGDIRRAEQWQQDLLDFTTVVRARHPGVPVFWFGESMGALITVSTAAKLGPRQQDTVAGIILTTPVVALRDNLKLPFLKNLALRTAIRLWPRKRISLEQLGDSEVQVTSGTTHREQMQHTPHYVKDFTVRLFAQIERLILRSSTDAAAVAVPALVLYTPNDVLTSREGVEHFFANLASRDKTKVFFPESYHLILHDKDRDAAVRHLREWLDRQTRP